MTSSLSSKLYDVAIVGSGPAGSSGALCLARQGMKVVIIEKDALPRYKTCGGGVTYRAIQLLPVDVQEAIELECYTAELNLLDAGLHFSTRRQGPIVSMTRRDKFDFLLVSAAKDAGADVLPECKVIDIITQADEVELVTNKGSLLARFVVAADGAMSLIARKTGWQETRYLAPALVCEVSVSYDVLRRFSRAARFDFGVVPCGYAWVFPKKGHLSIGVLCMRRTSINLKEMFERYVRILGISNILGLKRHGFLIPVSPRQDIFVKGRVLLTGDAAGLADPVTGEGITFAIQSGQIAARALLEGDFEEGRVKQAYDSALAKNILPELQSGRVLAKLIYDYPRMRTWLFRLYGQELSEAVTDVFMGKRTYDGILHNPLNYLRLFGFMWLKHKKRAHGTNNTVFKPP